MNFIDENIDEILRVMIYTNLLIIIFLMVILINKVDAFSDLFFEYCLYTFM